MRPYLFFILMICLGISGPSLGRGEIFSWTDSQGVRHFSNIAPPLSRPAAQTPENTIDLPQGFSCTVIKVFDGDTIQVKAEKIAFKVRLAGIDTPEKGYRQIPEQPFAREAKATLSRLVLNKKVVLRQHGTGSYNRVLAEVFSTMGNINLRMVRLGMAEVYQGQLPPSLDARAFKKAQEAARQEKIGIWSQPGAHVSPRTWRKRYGAN